jgi:hypothetical protein
LVLLLGAALLPAAARAGIHTWDVREVFSNADGSIQFVELWEANGGPGEINVGNGTLSSTTKSFAIGAGAVVGPTNNKRYLLGTAAFAALPGAPPVDALIPASVLPFFFNPAGDTVSFVPYDSYAFPNVPTNGIDSRDEIDGIGPNSPTNYAGQTGSVDASGGPSPVPAVSPSMLWIALLLVVGASFGAFSVRRA